MLIHDNNVVFTNGETEFSPVPGDTSVIGVFSSNYTLYADISARMNLVYNSFAPDVEDFSLKFSGYAGEQIPRQA
jgi:hypothetical protein